MKNIIAFFFILLNVLGIYAQNEVRSLRIKEAGTLKALIPERRRESIKELHIYGPANDEDLLVIKKTIQKYNNLKTLDLKNTEISELGDSVFSNCGSLTEVILPKGVKRIGTAAFLLCSNLKMVTFHEGLESVGKDAFYGCNNIKYIEFPEGTKVIGKTAISKCENLTTLIIPSSITTLDSCAFSQCKNLQVIRCLAVNPPTCIGSTFNGLKYDDCTLYIPSNTEKEYEKATIWSQFKNIQRLQKSKDMPTIVTSGTDANVITIFNKRAGTLRQQISANWLLAKQIRVRGPINVDDINFLKELAQYNGGNQLAMLDLTAITGLKELPDSAFTGCNSLNTIALPNDMTKIGKASFAECNNLVNVRLPKQLSEIGESAFYRCKNLYSIYIPSRVIKVGEKAFKECSSLNSVTLPEFLDSIDCETFMSCSKLTTITIPDRLTKIKGSAFWECEQLKTIILPDGLEQIGPSAFGECKMLKEINIPKSLKSIEEKVFWNCSNLAEVSITNNISIIGTWAFKDCSKLNKITLGKLVSDIKEEAFAGCLSLNEIHCQNPIPANCGSNTFEAETIKNCKLYIPQGATQNYVLSEGWWKFANVTEE